MRLLGFEIMRAKAAVAAMGVRDWLGQTGILESFSGAWQRNVVLDSTEKTLANGAVFTCVSLISKDIAKLRPRLMKLSADKIWEESPSPAFSPVLRKPNRYQTRNQFYAQWVVSKLVWGNTYVLKERDERGVVVAMYVLNPCNVVPLVAPDGEVLYQLGVNNLAGLQEGVPSVPASEIIHDRDNCLFHPLVGVGRLYAAGMSATQSNRIQANSAKFFENMSRPSGQLTAPGQISDEVAERLKREFETRFSGANIGRLLIAGDGLKFEPFTMPAEQAQLIEQLKWTVEDVARPFHVPLYKIGAGQMPQLGNISALNQDYYQQALQPLIEDIEGLLDEGLGLGEAMGVEFDLDGLLRMDAKTRAEVRDLEIKSAVLTPNEGRRQENRPPKIGGDALYLQQQNFSLEALAKRDQSEDPFKTGAPATEPQPAANDEDEEDAEEAAARAMREFLDHAMKGILECEI